ncbi:protein NASP homolog [Uranotaenia lowii]|uniref:protein NASP homolog n=1 Tax=Uranotaenia lowii TaxID=190385 RepID=UPI002478B1D3|nr:protein NASP homolog [Uranotaenia lowii]
MAEKSETLVTKDEKVAEAKELFGRGSRNYFMKDYTNAADDLSACCAIYSELYGPTAEECGMPYMLYAKSLIALGKDENALIVPGEEEEGEGEDGEVESAEQDNQPEDGEAGSADQSEEKSDEKPADKPAENDTEKAEADAGSSKEEAEPQPGPSTSNGAEATETTEESEEGEGDKTNLKVAWEILELAVKIFRDQGEKSYENMSDCYSELAGISFENSHFPEAITDYKKSLAVYDKCGKNDNRLKAEVYYKIGLCHLMINEFKDSIEAFRDACSQLDKVIEQEKAKEQNDETKAAIKDLEETKQEIMDKISEVEDTQKTSIEEVKRELAKIIVNGETSNGFGAAGSSSSAATNGASSSSASASATKNGTDKPTDISHLIKRKKPDSAAADVEGSPAKKTAVESEKPSE